MKAGSSSANNAARPLTNYLAEKTAAATGYQPVYPDCQTSKNEREENRVMNDGLSRLNTCVRGITVRWAGADPKAPGVRFRQTIGACVWAVSEITAKQVMSLRREREERTDRPTADN